MRCLMTTIHIITALCGVRMWTIHQFRILWVVRLPLWINRVQNIVANKQKKMEAIQGYLIVALTMGLFERQSAHIEIIKSEWCSV